MHDIACQQGQSEKETRKGKRNAVQNIVKCSAHSYLYDSERDVDMRDASNEDD